MKACDSNLVKFIARLSDSERRQWYRKRARTLRRTILAIQTSGGRFGGAGYPAWNKGKKMWTGLRRHNLRVPSQGEGYVVWNKKKKLSPAHKAALSMAAQRRASDPTWRASHSARMKGRPSPNKGKPIPAHVKAALNSPEACKKRVITRRKRFADNSLMLRRHYCGGAAKDHFRSDLDQRFRSTWEANIARVMTALGIPWTYEPDTLPRSDGTTYRPDFKVPKLPYIEVKGQPDKWEACGGVTRDRSAVLDGRLFVIDPACYASIRDAWKFRIGQAWEGN